MEYIEKENEDGSSSSFAQGEDALTLALGPDHRGYVRALGRSGVGVGIKEAFGKSSRHSRASRDEELRRMQEKMEAQMLAQFEAKMAEFQSQFQSRMEAQFQAQFEAQMQSFQTSSRMPSVESSRAVRTPPFDPPPANVCFRITSNNLIFGLCDLLI